MPANAVWQYDYIDYYRLDEKIIDQYLREKWGAYKYHVKLVGDRLAYMNPGGAGRVARATKAEDLRVPTHSRTSSSGDPRGVAVMFGAGYTGTVTGEQGVLIWGKECEWDKVAAGGADV
ncbi:MAG: hypothetical protein LQ349_007289 [Xanthoria aureola]|nr:MAG: hypothetical protein LQ349_007289 [Xanthoria aureola]